MEQFRCDSYCGLYCGACEIMVAYKRGVKSGKLPRWEDLTEEFRKQFPEKLRGEVKCLGCKSDTVFKNCKKCAIRSCAKYKMKVDSCFECRKFPCFRHKIGKFAIKHTKLGKRLPHLKTAMANLEVIKREGEAKWLEEQKKIWLCPKCLAEFSWYQKKCANCGMQVDSEKIG